MKKTIRLMAVAGLAFVAAAVAARAQQRTSTTEDFVLKMPSGADLAVKSTFSGIEGDNGAFVKDGPFTMRGAAGNGSYSLSTTFRNGRINGTLTGKGSEGGSVYAISGRFTDGIPDGPFFASVSGTGSADGKVSVNFSKGALTGTYSEIRGGRSVTGSFDERGYMSGTWKMGNVTAEYLNGVLISKTGDGRTTAPELVEIAKSLASGAVSEGELAMQGYLCLRNGEFFSDCLSMFLYDFFGLKEIGGFDFSAPATESVSVSLPALFTDYGFSRFRNAYIDFQQAGEVFPLAGVGFDEDFSAALDTMLFVGKSGRYYFRFSNAGVDGFESSDTLKAYLVNYDQYMTNGVPAVCGNVYMSPEQEAEVLEIYNVAAIERKKAEERRKAEMERQAKAKVLDGEILANSLTLKMMSAGALDAKVYSAYLVAQASYDGWHSSLSADEIEKPSEEYLAKAAEFITLQKVVLDNSIAAPLGEIAAVGKKIDGMVSGADVVLKEGYAAFASIQDTARIAFSSVAEYQSECDRLFALKTEYDAIVGYAPKFDKILKEISSSKNKIKMLLTASAAVFAEKYYAYEEGQVISVALGESASYPGECERLLKVEKDLEAVYAFLSDYGRSVDKHNNIVANCKPKNIKEAYVAAYSAFDYAFSPGGDPVSNIALLIRAQDKLTVSLNEKEEVRRLNKELKDLTAPDAVIKVILQSPM